MHEDHKTWNHILLASIRYWIQQFQGMFQKFWKFQRQDGHAYCKCSLGTNFEQSKLRVDGSLGKNPFCLCLYVWKGRGGYECSVFYGSIYWKPCYTMDVKSIHCNGNLHIFIDLLKWHLQANINNSQTQVSKINF